jgi:DNA invertase Pin-like site-specific DNA recombinase
MKPATSIKTPVAILLRVSTDKQSTDRQRSELEALAVSRGWEVVATVEEHGVSGKASREQRLGLDEVEALAQAGKIKKVLVHEISRVARRSSVAHGFVEKLEALGVSLYWHAQSIETLLPSGKRNPAAGIMLALLAEMARNEAETMKERINSGLAEARRKGKKLGRPEGSGYTPAQLLKEHKDIVRALNEGQSVRKAAKITDKGASTVQRVKAALALSKRAG